MLLALPTICIPGLLSSSNTAHWLLAYCGLDAWSFTTWSLNAGLSKLIPTLSSLPSTNNKLILVSPSNLVSTESPSSLKTVPVNRSVTVIFLVSLFKKNLFVFVKEGD